MITHQIAVYSKVIPKPSKRPHKQSAKFTGRMGSKEHRKYILERALINNPYTINEKVIYKRQLYTISEIYGMREEDFEWLDWDGLAPRFIELIDGDGEIQYVNPGVLKKAANFRRK